MPARIFCKVGPLKGVSAELGDEATLGRSRNATVRLQADLVSGEHARIRYHQGDGCYLLEDLGSTNGTALDGVRVRGEQRLGHLNVITLAGEYDFIFQDLALCAGRHPEGAVSAPSVPAPSVPKPSAPSVPKPSAPAPADFEENTAVDDEFPIPPPIVQAPPEGTQIDDLPPILPAAIAGLVSAAPAKDKVPFAPPDLTERTGIQEAPVALPSALGRKADNLRTSDGVRKPGASAAEKKKQKDKPTLKLTGPVTDASGRKRGETVTEDDLKQLLLGNAEASQAYALAVAWPDTDIQYQPLREGENVVGRGETSDVRIDSPDVSRRHAVVTVKGTEVTIRDVGSSNHTFVEGVQIEKGVPAQLQHGTRIKFGGIRVRLMHWVGAEDQDGKG